MLQLGKYLSSSENGPWGICLCNTTSESTTCPIHSNCSTSRRCPALSGPWHLSLNHDGHVSNLVQELDSSGSGITEHEGSWAALPHQFAAEEQQKLDEKAVENQAEDEVESRVDEENKVQMVKKYQMRRCSKLYIQIQVTEGQIVHGTEVSALKVTEPRDEVQKISEGTLSQKHHQKEQARSYRQHEARN